MDEISGNLITKGDFSHTKDLDVFPRRRGGAGKKLTKSLMHQP